MEVSSLSSLRTASLVWRRKGEWMQTVVCKATFSLRLTVSPLAEVQEPVREAEGYWNDNRARSIYVPSDLVPFKPRADVILVGKAFSREPASHVTARLVVATVDKRIDVHRDRSWTADGKLVQAPEFMSMPLLYERAAGGPGSWNPVGMRHVPKGAARVPNLVPHGFVLAEQHAPIPPAGFGAVAPRFRLGADAVVPDDLDPALFNVAPPDQQVDLIREDEHILLENLHRDHERFSTTLPGIRPWALAEAGGERQELPLCCDTLWIDTDREICTLTWRGLVALQTPADAGRIVVDLIEPDPEDTQDELHAPLVSDVSDPTIAPSRSLRPALPFAPALSVGEALVLRTRIPAGAPAEPEPVEPAPPLPPASRKVSIIGPWAPPGERADASCEAAPATVLAASNAALLGEARTERAETVREPPPEAKASSKAVELISAELAMVPRIRRKPAWRPLLAEQKAPPRDDEPLEGEPAEKRREAKDRRDVLAVLRRGEPASARGIEAEVAASMEDGAFIPPLALVEGSLELPFDEKEMLKATVGLLAPFRAGDRRLKEQCETAEELLRSPWLEQGTAGVETFTGRLREAFSPAAHGLPPGYLEARADRLLLEQRRYQKRTLLGRAWIRALFTPAGGGGPIPAYLDARLADELPMFQRFDARAIAEIRMQLDQYELHDRALRVVALGRLLSRPGR